MQRKNYWTIGVVVALLCVVAGLTFGLSDTVFLELDASGATHQLNGRDLLSGGNLSSIVVIVGIILFPVAGWLVYICSRKILPAPRGCCN